MKNKEILLRNNVDVDSALEIWGNDIDAYNESLKDYYNSLESKLTMLTNYKNNYDYQNYAILAHSLKSESKYFGFMNEANVFLEHELKGKENDSNFIMNNFGVLERTVKKILEILNEYFQEGSSKKTILAVDDSNIVLNFIENSLKNDFNILKATNGNDALTYISSNDIYAILLDLNMPNSNGFEVLSYLKDHNLISLIPVIIITGDDNKDTIDKAFSYPILDVLNKPFTIDNLNRVLQAVANFYENKN